MNWIRCDFNGGEVMGLRYIRRFEVKSGREAHTVKVGDLACFGSQSVTTYHHLPSTGFVILAWCGGVNSGPRCVGHYASEREAQQVLGAIFAEPGEGSKAVDVPAIRARLDRRQS